MFYLMPVLFIWVEIYHLLNKDRLYNKRSQVPKWDIAFYIIKMLYLLWIIIEIFTISNYYLYIIIILSALKFPILLLKSKKIDLVYDVLCGVVTIILLMLIMANSLSF